MGGYKRNQGLEAISEVIGQGQVPSARLRTDVKRLLDTDRGMRVVPTSNENEPDLIHYAFFRDVAPGRGVEVLFSEYEIFALYVGVNLMAHGWPQATAVSILRRARAMLERKHAAILRWDRARLFDTQKIRETAEPGTLAVGSTRPVFLVISSRKARSQSSSEATEIEALEERKLGLTARPAGTSMTLIELTRTAHDLRNALMKTEPSKRGRSSS